jgi:predicted Zn-ribbon and HTH transcriptional regulator
MTEQNRVDESKLNINTTDTGYINKNNQMNNGKTNQRGSDNNQFFYEMKCLNCGYVYMANGTNIKERKCPRCQGGKP